MYHNTPHGGHGMTGKSPMGLYDELTKNHTPKPCADEHLRACRPLVKRLKLRDQCNFEFKIDGFGLVTYIPDESLNLRRGWEYDVLPDNANPKAAALIYDGEKYLGEARYQEHTQFLDKIAGQETMRNRNGTIKRTKAGVKAAKGQQAAIQTAPGQLLVLSALPGCDTVIKPQPVPQGAAPPRYVELQNGDLADTLTGEVTPKVKPKTPEKPKQTAEEIEAELEQLAAAQSAKRNAAKLKHY